MVAGPFHDARTEDQPLTRMAESDTRPKKSVSAHGGTFVQDPTGIRAEPINDILPRDRQREPIAQGLIANATNDIPRTWPPARSSAGAWPTIRAQLMAGEEMGVQALNLLRQALWQMGGTPADRTQIETPEEISDDPAERFFDA